MLQTLILYHPWIAVVAWVVLYTSDYHLTLWGERLYRAQNHVLHTGSYELTPGYQNDVDSQRKVSWRFLLWLVSGAVWLLIPCALAVPGSSLYSFVFLGFVGLLLVPEVFVHCRHLHNICFYRALQNAPAAVSGSITYSRSLTYRVSATESLGWSLALLMAYALTSSPVLLGGVVGMLRTTYHHLRYARRAEAAVGAASEEQVANVEAVDEPNV